MRIGIYEPGGGGGARGLQKGFKVAMSRLLRGLGGLFYRDL